MLKKVTLNTITTATTTVPVISTSAVNSANAVMLPAPAANVVIAPAVQTPAANTAPTAQTAVANTPMLPVPQAPAANVVIPPVAQVPAANTANTATASVRVTKKQAKADLDATIKNVLKTGDVLAIKHTDYYDTYITKSNEVLSDLLTEIMEYAEMVFASSDVDAVIKAIRNALKNSYGIKVQKNSNNIAVIVRYITRTNRKNAHVYARAIKLAFDAGKTSAELANFIEENGGVSKIREKNVNAAEVELRDKRKRGIVFYTKCWLKDLAENNAIATFKVDAKRNVELHDMTRGGEFKYMICKSIGNGEYAVIDAVANVDKEFEEKVFWNYYWYKHNDYRIWHNLEMANAEFRGRIEANINKWNELRIANGLKLLDIYGDVIEEEIEEKNDEIK